jgi:hypothetical protein
LTWALASAYDQGCFYGGKTLLLPLDRPIMKRASSDNDSTLRHGAFRRPVVALACMAYLMLASSTARAVTPESPEVKQIIAKAVTYLETANQGVWESHPGAKSLVAMCILKQFGHEAGKKHPKVAEAVASIRATLASGFPPHQAIYNIGICLIFLLDLDHAEYRPEMEQLLGVLLAAQKPHGGFGYPDRPTGDTSMGQYGALGMWACQMAGISVPVDHWERALGWLMRTQDPSGGYGYQGVEAGGSGLVAQTEIRLSLSAAGLGSVCICADSLRLFADSEAANTGPAALKRVVKEKTGPLTKSISATQVSETLARGQGWFAKNYTSDYKMNPEQWIPYYMYALERYKSFYFLINPNPKDDNQWYDDGYAVLSKLQTADGSWHFGVGDHFVADTAFAVLFLSRSTQKIINHAKTFGGGLLVGGRGLPENAGDVELRQGSIRAKALKGPAMDLLQKMSNPDDPNFEEAVRGMEEQSLVDAGDGLTDVQKRLRSMAEGKSPEAKAAALNLLGRTRDLNNVPLLIEALRADDPRIVDAATSALKFLSRKFVRSGLYGDSQADARKQAIDYWKAWYRDIRPDAKFDDE